MTRLRNSAEGGTNGTLASTSNTGGASGDVWQQVQRTSAASSLTFSSAFAAVGTLSYAVAAASGETCQLIWTFTGGSGAAVLFYYKHPGTPTAETQLAQIRHGSGNAGIISVGTDNKLILKNATGGNIRVSPVALAAGDEIWCTARALKGTSGTDGTHEYSWGYRGSPTAQDSWLSTNNNAGTANMASVRVGRTVASTWVATQYFDEIEAETDATALIPPLEQRTTALAVDVSGSGTVAATLAPVLPLSVALSGSGTVAQASAPALPLPGSPSGSGAVSAAVSPALSRAAATSGSGTTATSTSTTLAIAAAVSGSGTLTASTPTGSALSVSLSGSGTVAVTVTRTGTTAGASTSSGTVAVVLQPRVPRAAALSGSGTAAAAAASALEVAAAAAGEGVTSATLALHLAIAADLAGEGYLEAAQLPRVPDVRRLVPATPARTLTAAGVVRQLTPVHLDEEM